MPERLGFVMKPVCRICRRGFESAVMNITDERGEGMALKSGGLSELIPDLWSVCRLKIWFAAVSLN